MPKVLLKRTYIGPDGVRYRANEAGTNIPDGYPLPKDAKVIDDTPVPAKPKAAPVKAPVKESEKEPASPPAKL